MSIHKSVHSQRLERWLGAGKINGLSASMRGWYGPPIHLLDCPGSVRLGGDGDFSGDFKRGYYMTAMDSLEHYLKKMWRVASTPQPGVLNAGFASIADALAQASKGFRQYPGGQFVKTGAALGSVGNSTSSHKLGTTPVAGVAAAGAPGGTVFVDSDLGGMPFTNPSVGTTRLTGATVHSATLNHTLLLYDRLFGVLKVMNDVTAEAVTGVPTRYQSTTATSEDYIGGNFGFVEVGLTALAATAHNWTVCTYTDQAGAASTLPSLTGVSGQSTHNLDHPSQQWFAPLEAGDTGIGAWTQIQCSATVATGTINFVIGHPLGFMSFPVLDVPTPFDWLTNRDLAPRIFDDAYLAFLEVCKPSSGGLYTGRLEITSTSS